jgi:EAL and modified HD-GYP domain-containing signal transduction protein|tara:strand:- start:3215 stop:4429 length:1215 start_codon:yes stop_codon:yes gene_type:complete
MNVYTARQAIFNRKSHVVAYELLFRDSAENFFPKVDPHEATAKLIMRTHLNDGLMPITYGKPALINFCQQSLLQELPLLLPNKQVMVEILETVEPSDEVFNACRKLYHQGYHLALDDFIYQPEWARFFNLCRLIKIDLMETPLSKVAPLIASLKKRKKIKLLAEKVETQEEFEQAKEMGFNFFQGYFFCKPEMQEKRDVEGNKLVLIELYQEVMKIPLNVKALTSYFEHDVGLSYKLLRFINSGIIPISQEICSIKQALVYLGDEKTRKFIALITTAMLADKKPKELIRTAIIRAKFCELAASRAFAALADEAFLVGLFSLLDAILDQSMGSILESLALSDDIADALAESSDTALGILIATIRLYEAGEWYRTENEAQKIGLNYKQLASYYQKAILWADAYDRI